MHTTEPRSGAAVSDGGARIEVDLVFERMPSVLACFAKAAASGKPGAGGEDLRVPAMRARLRGLQPQPEHVRRYAALCGGTAEAMLPLAYPHVLASPLHLALLTHAAFPLRLPGLVHVANRVRRWRDLPLAQALDLQVELGGQRDVERGMEFDMRTQAFAEDGELLWEGVSTMLARRPARGPRSPAPPPPDLEGLPEIAAWQAPANIGRRYGLLAGDLNPIHVHALTARLFGFRRAIAHGMWSYARCAEVLLRLQPATEVTLEVAFQRPLLLPGRVVLLRMPEPPETTFVLTDPARQERYLRGRMAVGGK